jgi:hypothetical protein
MRSAESSWIWRREAALNSVPDALTKEEMTAKDVYEADGGGFNNALGRLRTLELVHGCGEAQVLSTGTEVLPWTQLSVIEDLEKLFAPVVGDVLADCFKPRFEPDDERQTLTHS